MKVDRDQYQQGRNAFTEGRSLIAVVERVKDVFDFVADQGPAASFDLQAAEDAALSFGLGFFDAALDRLRGIVR